MKKKQRKILNRGISFFLAFVFGYILLFNNSLDFLIKFGIEVNKNLIAFLGFFLTMAWVIWKKEAGEI